ncbi:MAG: DNA-binding protein WhiA [Candidatus Dormibacteraeota bacterium]|nr:DNA-binding protein WhiA [Candidatus Dormibacteraeota bacterium]
MADRPSFTDDVKAELANVPPARPCCREAELHAMVGTLAAKRDVTALTIRVPRNAVARKIVQLARTTGGTVAEVVKGPTEKRPSYRLRLTLPAGRGSTDSCCARATLRGAFLARGVLGNPADAYHLEIDFPPGGEAPVLAAARRAGIPLRRGSRRGKTIVYLKGAEPISGLLGLMGANRAVMRFENDRILRDMRSQANRRVNSETANLDKRLRAALQQVDAIKQLKGRDPGLTGLPPALREAADLRLSHPRAGLLELAGYATLSKSAIANRLRRLMARATSNGATWSN